MELNSDDLRLWRTAHGLSQSQLADLLPVKLATLQKWERDFYKPPPFLERALRDLAAELNAKQTKSQKRKASRSA